MIATFTIESHQQLFVAAMEVRRYSPATLSSYQAALAQFVDYLKGLGLHEVREISRQQVRDYLLWLKRQPYSARTVLSRFQAVRRFFEHLEATDAILVNPAAGITVPRPAYHLPRHILTVDEAKAVLAAPNVGTPAGIRDKAILELFYSTGIRLEEMARLSTQDVDCQNGVLRVNHGKCAKDRVVPLGKQAGESLREYLHQCRQPWNRGTPNQLALWLSARLPHGPIKSQAISVMVKHYGRKAGLKKHVTPHVWRHTCATHLVAEGANIAYVQRILGHRSSCTTQVYAHTTIGEIQATHTLQHPRNQSE